jgi:uncharacterized protein (TIGR00369 family)
MHANELQQLLDESPVHRSLRLRVIDSTDASVTLECVSSVEHVGADGSPYLHGGVVATVLDTAATFALIQATGTDWSTVDLRLDYLRPAPAGSLCATGTAVQVGRRLGRATAQLTDTSSGRVLGTAAGTFARTAPQPNEDDERND